MSRLSSNSEGICLHSVFIVHPICLLTEIYIPLNADSEIEMWCVQGYTGKSGWLEYYWLSNYV